MAVEKMNEFAGITDSQKITAFGNDQSAPKTRELMLSLRQLTGKAEAFPYAYLYNVQKNSDGTAVMLTYSAHIVSIEGKNLEGLYDALLGWGIQFVQEMKPEDRGDSSAFVKSISIMERQPFHVADADE
jgi:hypothetical protein